MRRLLAASAAVALAGAAPAGAAPAVHAAVVTGISRDTTVTCDTSSYPAASYPCRFDMTVTSCLDPVTARGCDLSVRGEITAYPSSSPVGQCAFSSSPRLTLTYDTAADPAFHVERENEAVIVPRAGVLVHSGAYYTAWYVVFALEEYGDAMGAVTTSFGFGDLAWDCRSRDGGDPTNDGFGTVPFVTNPTGAFVFHQA